MSQPNPEFIERYQLEYEKNPNSRIFAPLAEAYRKMGLLHEAHRICERGVQIHPEFAGGQVAFAKVLLEMQKPKEALTQLKKAAELAPDNLLAHQLTGETLLQLRRPKEALNAFKMVLFLSPNDERAKSAVRKWEFLSADEYDEELFEMKPIFRKEEKAEHIEPLADSDSGSGSGTRVNSPPNRALERAISLADAFTIRGEMERALELLIQARQQLGPAGELEKRIQLLRARTRTQEDAENARVEPPSELNLQESDDPIEQRRAKLEKLLARIEERRLSEV